MDKFFIKEINNIEIFAKLLNYLNSNNNYENLSLNEKDCNKIIILDNFKDDFIIYKNLKLIESSENKEVLIGGENLQNLDSIRSFKQLKRFDLVKDNNIFLVKRNFPSIYNGYYKEYYPIILSETIDIAILEHEFLMYPNTLLIADNIKNKIQLLDILEISKKHNKQLSFKNLNYVIVNNCQNEIKDFAKLGLLKSIHTDLITFDDDILDDFKIDSNIIFAVDSFLKYLNNLNVNILIDLMESYKNYTIQNNNHDKGYNFIFYNKFYNGRWSVNNATKKYDSLLK